MTACNPQVNATFMVDVHGFVQNWSAEAARIFGFSDREIIDRDRTCFFTAEDIAQGLPQAELSRATANEWADTASRRVRKDGSVFQVRGTVTAVRDRDGSLVGFVETLSELAELPQLGIQPQLEESSNRLQILEFVSQLSVSVIHGINNAITSILGTCEELLAGSDEDVPLSRSIESISLSANRIAELIRQLQFHHQVNHCGVQILDVNRLASDFANIWQQVRGKTFPVVTVLDPEITRLKLDAGPIHGCLMALLTTANDATRHSGTLTIKTEYVEIKSPLIHAGGLVAAGTYVLLSVTETGIGLNPDSRIVDPFSGAGSGSGAGGDLASPGIPLKKGSAPLRASAFQSDHDALQRVSPLFQRVIEKHSDPTRSTADTAVSITTRFYLPVVEHQARASMTVPEARNAINTQETVILVEAQPIIRRMMTKVLQSRRYEVLASANGEEAIKQARDCQQPIQLLITNVDLAGLSGQELAEVLRSTIPKLKVLFVGGDVNNTLAGGDQSSATIERLRKPFSSTELLFKVRQLLGHLS